ncbi:EcsC family protein [Acinetobacter indicus]|nr:EcsC family protein [Acinetobacter indicus]MDM1320945.1 EcsC family protein [Acinetobacter indicus]MDM1332749.1 EcsC family protein [Acinetobacter indicus]QIZ60429.1 EcsC family protein [Acinetobacter indicus]
MEVLEWTYDKALAGGMGIDSAQELADSYLKENGSLENKINSLIRWQNTKSATSGFLTGIGGLATMPVAVPANFASVMFVQIRMVAAIAYMCGYDIKDDQVKTFVYACLTGNALKDMLKDVGIIVGSKLTRKAIESISGKMLIEINKRVGFRLFTKFGTKGVINLGKAIPLVGGVIGASFDGISTNIVGNTARDLFLPNAQSSILMKDVV